ncbi:PP2C family protein-serine/threonine phosphatase [Streptomyces sp. HC307]|uniref:PP2C family protein-serine/threonine phosphatase n=1 Tax=Streptomyces flavusporus TaxID=3385496 RepID=UPI003916E6FC
MIRNLRVPGRVVALGLPTMWGVLVVVFFAVVTGLVLHVRHTLLRELRQARRVAAAAQDALLRPMPPRIDGLNVAAAQLSADRGSSVGGDLYEVVATEHGVRVVMGDVRGHGLAAIGTVAAVLGSFRETVHDEPELAGVLRRLDRALARYLRERADGLVAEEFVTVLLLEIWRGGEVRALNCGHPWPYRLLGTHVEPLARADPLPPLGPFPLPPDLPAVPFGQLRPDEALFLFTDGAEDARDAHGRFFPLPDVLAEALHEGAHTPQSMLSAVFTRVLRHTSGCPTDDIALLALRNERHHRRPSGAWDSDTCGSAARARATTPHPQPTTHR